METTSRLFALLLLLVILTVAGEAGAGESRLNRRMQKPSEELEGDCSACREMQHRVRGFESTDGISEMMTGLLGTRGSLGLTDREKRPPSLQDIADEELKRVAALLRKRADSFRFGDPSLPNLCAEFKGLNTKVGDKLEEPLDNVRGLETKVLISARERINQVCRYSEAVSNEDRPRRQQLIATYVRALATHLTWVEREGMPSDDVLPKKRDPEREKRMADLERELAERLAEQQTRFMTKSMHVYTKSSMKSMHGSKGKNGDVDPRELMKELKDLVNEAKEDEAPPKDVTQPFEGAGT